MTMNEPKQTTIVNKALLYALLLFVFLIPLYGKILPPLILIILILWFINGSIKNKICNLKKSFVVVFLQVFFYLLHIIGMLYTDNVSEGLFDLEVKFSLFLFPIMIFSDKEFFKRNHHLI